jgi:hypothetical protein
LPFIGNDELVITSQITAKRKLLGLEFRVDDFNNCEVNFRDIFAQPIKRRCYEFFNLVERVYLSAGLYAFPDSWAAMSAEY